MTKTRFFRQRKTKKYGVLQERFHENEVAFLLFFIGLFFILGEGGGKWRILI